MYFRRRRRLIEKCIQEKEMEHRLAAKHTCPRLTHLWMDKMKYQHHRRQDMR
jgi:hypothetical protein